MGSLRARPAALLVAPRRDDRAHGGDGRTERRATALRRGAARAPDRAKPVVNRRRLAVRFERALALALLAPDPRAAVRRLACDRRHPRDLSRALGRVSGDGVEMASLLVARLRFERLV